MGLMSSAEILWHMVNGSVVIDPFEEWRLNTDSYDLTLGPFFWRYTEDVKKREPAEMARGEGFELFDARDTGHIWLGPGERVLGHTVEVIGGRVANNRAVTTAMHATSTAGRHGLTVCQCAGWGDVGYVNIWTMEIGNNLQSASMKLPVGATVAQLSFSEVVPPDSDYCQGGGSYGTWEEEAQAIRSQWRPEDMLPKPLKVTDNVKWEMDNV